MQIKLKDETILKCVEFNTGINGASEVMFVLEGDYLVVKPLLTKENLSSFEEIRDEIIIGVFNGYDTITNLSSVLNTEDETKSIIVVSLKLTAVTDVVLAMQEQIKILNAQMESLKSTS